MGEIVELPAKLVSGQRRNVQWVVCFNKHTRKWEYHITVILEPRLFTGEYDTEHQAREHVDNFLRIACHV